MLGAVRCHAICMDDLGEMGHVGRSMYVIGGMGTVRALWAGAWIRACEDGGLRKYGGGEWWVCGCAGENLW